MIDTLNRHNIEPDWLRELRRSDLPEQFDVHARRQTARALMRAPAPV
ncbi:MAG: hypothetical protein ACRD6N_01165 [Pyrinomonadaceae bacterium]